MRLIVSIGAVGMLAACSPDVDQPQADAGAQTIDCALGEGSEFGPDCLVERNQVDGRTILTVRHPDGGFRRFEQVADGRGLIETDGADEATRSLDDSVLEIGVGQDRYRFDAAVQGTDDATE